MPENFNQVVKLDTYQNLVKQETNELLTSANSSAANKDNFQHYYQHLSADELSELKVFIQTSMILTVSNKIKTV